MSVSHRSRPVCELQLIEPVERLRVHYVGQPRERSGSSRRSPSMTSLQSHVPIQLLVLPRRGLAARRAAVYRQAGRVAPAESRTVETAPIRRRRSRGQPIAEVVLCAQVTAVRARRPAEFAVSYQR